MADPDFDWSQAESLLGEDPQNVPRDMADIVLELVQSARERFAEMKELNPVSDRPAISAAAHQLRGSLLNFGFAGVGAILQEIEMNPYADADYPRLLAGAEAAFFASEKMLGAHYPTLRLG